MTEENSNNKKLDYRLTKEELESGKAPQAFKISFLKSHAENTGEFVEDFRKWKLESLAMSRYKVRGYNAQLDYNC